MANLEKDLAKFETPFGYITGDVLRLWSAHNTEIDKNYTTLIETPVKYKGVKPPIGYAGKKTGATPVQSHMLALIVALAKVKFEKRYNLQEACDLLLKHGIQVSRQGLMKVFPRISDAIGVTDTIPKRGRKVNIKTLADAEALVQQERKKFAKQAKKEGLSGEEVRERLNEQAKDGVTKAAPKSKHRRTIESKEEMTNSEEFAGREVIYEPTPKQVLFHAASEKIVLYGGAAG